MKILLLSQLFQPEPNHLKGLSFAKELVRLGHEVEVLTCFPNYPAGRLYAGYRQRFFSREYMDNIRITRVPLFIDHSNSGLRRILSYLSFAITATTLGIFLVNRPDVVHVYQGPATLAIPAMAMQLLWNVPYVLDIQDLWPESVTGSGMLNLPYAEPLLSRFCEMTYRLANRIIVLSKGYKETLQKRSVPESKIHVVYNWCDEGQMLSGEKAPLAAHLFQPDRLNIVYAGNMGRLQALDAVIHAAGILADQAPQVRMFFVGDGVETDNLKKLAESNKVPNVRFIPRQTSHQIGAILDKADALLIHLKDEPLCRIGIPQKTQAYMAAGKPIILAVKGEASELSRQAGSNIECEPENPKDIARAILNLANMTTEERYKAGVMNREFYNKALSFEIGIKNMISIFNNVTELR